MSARASFSIADLTRLSRRDLREHNQRRAARLGAAEYGDALEMLAAYYIEWRTRYLHARFQDTPAGYVASLALEDHVRREAGDTLRLEEFARCQPRVWHNILDAAQAGRRPQFLELDDREGWRLCQDVIASLRAGDKRLHRLPPLW